MSIWSSLSRKRLAAIAVVLLLLATLAAFGVARWRAARAHVPPATEQVALGNIETTVRATGEIRPLREVEVGTLASGQLRTLAVKLGERVVSGQLLAEIDPTLAENEVRRSRAALDEALAQRDAALARLRLLTQKVRRARALYRTEALSEAKREEAEAEFTQQQAAVGALEASVRRARVAVESDEAKRLQTRIVAPIDGEVVQIKIQEGQSVVAAQTAQVILTLANLRTVTVQVRVSEADVVGVAAGQPTAFTTLAEPGRRIDGTVRAVEPAPFYRPGDSSGAIYYNALADVDNADGRLRVGMTVDATIVTASASQVLTVPASAVLHGSADTPARVYVLDGERPVKRDVVLGISNELRAQAREGLRAGERVVIDAAAVPDGDARGRAT